MNTILLLEASAILLALVVSFVVLVIYGPASTPAWLIYASFPIMAIGGGAAIHLILYRPPFTG